MRFFARAGLAAVCTIAVSYIASAAPPRQMSGKGMFLEMTLQLRGEDEQAAAEVLWGYEALHDEVVSKALMIADQDPVRDPDARQLQAQRQAHAVRLLATLRVRRAIPILLRRIDVSHRPEEFLARPSREHVLPFRGYPYALALLEFGSEAIPGALQHAMSVDPQVPDSVIDLHAQLLIELGVRRRAMAMLRDDLAKSQQQDQPGLKRLLDRLTPIAERETKATAPPRGSN
jgi:hypothetical protein